MKKQKLNKKKLNKKVTLGVTAAALSVAVATTGIFNYLQPMEAYARESFSGTKKIVQEHTDEPYVILDIVPSYATYTWSEDLDNPENSEILEFSTATLSALVKGQAVMEEEYAKVYEDKALELKKYEARRAFADAVWLSAPENDTWGVRYEEAYAGTRKELESAADIEKKGWHLLIETETLEDEDKGVGGNASSGLMYGYYVKYEEQPTASPDVAVSPDVTATPQIGKQDKTGYDYIKVGEWEEEDTYKDLTDAVYVYDKKTGNYQLIFEKKDASGATYDHPVSGYLMVSADEITSENVSDYADATGVYTFDEENQRYYYAGVLGDYRSNFEETDENAGEPTATPSVTPTVTPTALPEEESATPSVSPEEPSETPAVISSETPTAEPSEMPTVELVEEPTAEPVAQAGAEPTAEPTQEPEQAVLGARRMARDIEIKAESVPETSEEDNSTYYVLTFEYYADITDPAQVVYQISKVEEVSEELGEEERPADTYALFAAEERKVLDGVELEEEPEENPVFLYVGSGLGDYRLIEQGEVTKEYKTKYEPVKMEVRNAPTYFRFTGGCDWLREAVFHSLEEGDNANTNFKLQIVTLRVDEVTVDWINKADLIYLENGDAPFLHTKAASEEPYVKLHWLDKDTETVKDEETQQILGMTRENMYALIVRAVYDKLPVMLDASITWNDKLKDSNYQSLAGVLLKEDLETYVLDANTSTDWLVGHLADDAYPDKTDNGINYVNKNIYVINSSTPLVNSDFKESFTQESAQGGFGEVLDFIYSENVVSGLPEEEQISETVSKARAIEYIINYAVGLVADYPNLKILELQPTDNNSGNLYGALNPEGGNTLYFKRSESTVAAKQVLKSSSAMEVDITVKSPAALNSEWADLNGTYNLIFIGLDGQKLNHLENVRDIAIYNDETLDGKVYHSGDLAKGMDARYDPIDITEGKKQALLEFMKAGYPVLVDNDCFVNKTAKNVDGSEINTRYIAADTRMYEFLKEAVENDLYAGKIYTVEDVYNNVMFRAQLATNRPVISLNEEEASEGLYLLEQESGAWSCDIPYEISSLYGDTYSGDKIVECYLDINDDGGYSEEEKISGRSQDDALIWAVDESDRMVVNFAQDPGSRAIPCRLIAYDNGNPYLRSEIKDVLQITGANKEKVRILQIGSPDATSLAALYEQNDSVLSYYLRAAENAMNAEFEITTMSMSDPDQVSGKNIATMLTENPDYLMQYDMLVLGFGNGSETLPTDAVTGFVNEGRSVLVSYKGATEEGSCLSLSRELLGQLQNKTYVKLGRDSGNSLFRYSGMHAGMFGDVAGLYAEGINDGSVYHYPNEIGKMRGFSADKTSLKAGDYRLDLSNEEFPYVTPWFVLSGTGDSAYPYQVSRHDGGNNYYLYSKGNVVYIGHQDYSGYTYQADNENNPVGDGLNECEMFVNAMILAYNAGVHDIRTEIVAGFEQTAARVESISIPFDQEIAEGGSGESGLLDETVDVYFRYKDSNLAVNKNYEVFFYYEDAAGSVQLNTGEKMVAVTPFTSELWTVEENVPVRVDVSQLSQGKVYRIKAPAEALKNNSSTTQAGVYVEIRCNLSRPGGEKSVRGCDGVALNRVQLFMLE